LTVIDALFVFIERRCWLAVISSIFLCRSDDFEVTWSVVEGGDNIDSTNDVSREYTKILVTSDYFGICLPNELLPIARSLESIIKMTTKLFNMIASRF
jgi:hypothetical protein